MDCIEKTLGLVLRSRPAHPARRHRVKRWLVTAGARCLVLSVVFLGCGQARRDAAPGSEDAQASGGDGGGAGAGGAPAEPVDCTTENPCLRSFLDEETGECVTEPRSGACDDDNPCTSNDRCDDSGDCAGEPRDCDDGRDCTVDSCDPDVGCIHPTDPDLCDDGNDCTRDVCSDDGECENEPESGNACGGADCVAESVCDDGECVEQSVDSAGVCYPEIIDFGDVIVGMTAVETLALEAAEGGFDVEAIESQHPDISVEPLDLPVTVPKDETLDVDLNWTPSAEGDLDSRVEVDTGDVTWHVQVVGRALPQPDCDDDNPCTADGFDTDLGECTTEPTPDVACDDGNACTVDDACDAEGVCQPGDYLECPDGEVCKAGACEEQLCRNPEDLSPVCRERAAPFDEGCLCELVRSTAPESVQLRIDALLNRQDFEHQIFVSMFLGEALLDGWQLDLLFTNDGNQAVSIQQVLVALSRWDLGEEFVVPGVSQPPDLASIRTNNLLFAYENLGDASAIPGILDAHAFAIDRDGFRLIGFTNSQTELITDLLAADEAGQAATLDAIAQVLANRNDSFLITNLNNAF